ncbi:MAG: methylenetetrahydrofolate reductase [Candidatus Omnitrophica bacterium]|nr:methylenetetrahydrofolate reductase [Candidatus Omnitrophota bacterium]
MNFCEKLKAGKFVVTSEIGPPKGTDIKGILDDALLIRGRVDAVNVTDLQSSVMRAGSASVCHLLKDLGIEPIFQITCRDRNRLALQSDLLSASILGIENVLVLTGDYPTLGDHPEAKPVFDLGSVQLLEVLKGMQEGRDMKGNPLQGSPHFCVGAVVNPGADPLEPEVIRMEQKIAAGARFFQTQAVYDIEIFRRFIKATAHLKVPVLAGIVLLKSVGMARFMNKNVSGVFVPDELIREMESATDRTATSVDIATRLIRGLKPLCQGIHIMPIGWNKMMPLVLDSAGL